MEWAEALKSVQDESRIEVENKAGMKNQVGGFAESLHKLYVIVVVKGKIQVLYGWRVARAIETLENDRRVLLATAESQKEETSLHQGCG